MRTRTSARTLVLILPLLLGVACSQPTPDELFADATEALAAGEVRTANIHLRNLLQQDPENADARALLARVSLAMGDFAGAEQFARRAIELGANPVELQIPLLQALAAQGENAEVLAQFDAGPALPDAARSVALTILGGARRNLGDAAGAEEAFRSALALAPESLDAMTRLAAVRMDSGDGDEARHLTREALRRDPQYSPALLIRASLEIAGERLDTAEATLRRVMEIEQGRQQGAQYLAAATQLIQLQLRSGELAAAADAAESLLQANPGNVVARFVKADVEIRQGEIDSAEQRLDALIADAPGYWPAYRLLGTIDAQQNQFGQAEQNLLVAVNNDPSDALARLQLAEVYARQGKLEEARQVFESSPAAQLPSDSLFLALAGGASLQAGQTELAAAYFERSELLETEDTQQLANIVRLFVAAGEYERAIRLIDAAGSDDPAADYLAALVRLQQGNVAAAEEIADRLIEARPELAGAYSLRGVVALYAGEVDAAREFMQSGLNIDPRNVGLLLGLARVELAAENAPGAEQRLREVVSIDASQVNALYGLAELAAARGDNSGAKSWLMQAPDSPLRDLMLGRLELLGGRFDAAADLFAHAFEAQPTVELAGQYYLAASRAGRPDAEDKLLAWVASNPLDVQANFVLGGAALAARNLDRAIERYEAVIQVEPEHAAALNNLAWLHSQQGDDGALDYAERAYAAAPDAPAIADTLGWLLLQQGATARALGLLEDAATALPDNPEIQYHFGAALADSGESTRARDVFGQLLASPTEFDGRADAERRLRGLQNGSDSQP